MKTNRWALFALAIFIAITGFSKEIPKMNIVKGDKDRILVAFESQTPCPVKITVTDDKGKIVYSWQSESAGNFVNHQLNTKELGKGTFNVALNYGCRSINRELYVSRKEIKIGPAVQLLEPFFCFKNDKLNVSFLNIANKNVYLNIYKDGNHYDGFKLGKDLDIQKSVDFSMVEKGNYDIVLSDYFKEHHYTVSK
jgi:hypothetical protein